MKITKEQLEKLNLYQYPEQPHLFGDYEDKQFNQNTNELFYHSCVDGSLELYRKVNDIEDLKQALWDGFKFETAQKD